MTFLSAVHPESVPDPSPLISKASGISMGKYGGKSAKHGAVDSHGWRAFLKTCHPTKTAQGIAARTGISADTVEKWFRAGASPSFDAALILAEVYGPEFLSTCVPGCRWMAHAAREARRAALDELIESASSERERLLGQR